MFTPGNAMNAVAYVFVVVAALTLVGAAVALIMAAMTEFERKRNDERHHTHIAQH